MQKKNILNLFLTISISAIVGLLIYKQLLYPTIIPMVIKGGASLFADWTVILNANNCLANGYDVYLENPCDHWNRKHVYGEILLNIPYIKTNVIDRKNYPYLGVGEVVAGPTGAAISNAISNALGQTIKTMPFTKENITKELLET